jgi:glycosyltransferase involved in cell wall biosynthesis
VSRSPLISCIVPVFNGERYLGEALDSIVAQTYRPLEIIVVDDGSTDGTAAVVARCAEAARYFCRANSGPPAARNFGVSVAHGELVAFLDADDRWHPEKLARQMARFRARPELDLSITGGQNYWMPEVVERDERSRDPRHAEPWPGYVSTVTLLARRRAFDVVGPFNTTFNLWDDREWFIRAAEAGLVKELLRQVLVYRRLHDANISNSLTPAIVGLANVELVKASLDRRRRRQWAR